MHSLPYSGFYQDDSFADESQAAISSHPESQPGPTMVPLAQSPSSPTSFASLSAVDPSMIDMISLPSHLCLLTDRLCLSSGPSVSSIPTPPRPDAPVVLSAMTPDKVLKLLHRSNTSPPSVRPCDTPNNPTLRLIGLWMRFIRLWVVSSFGITGTSYRSVEMVNGSTVANFLPLLNPLLLSKAKHGQSLDCTHYLYLDAVCVDVSFH
jgi:hypothetical protein